VQFNVQAPRQQRQPQPQRAVAAPVGVRSPGERALVREGLRASGGSAAAREGNGRPKPAAKLGRNDICPFCDSGKKLKHCQCEGARRWRGEL
jgi:uncharacterized protein YecA (UPF0149 family)